MCTRAAAARELTSNRELQTYDRVRVAVLVDRPAAEGTAEIAA
jgi:hypothetical protein